MPTKLHADAYNVYKRHTPLHIIIEDGWSRGFDVEQTIQEASNAGYANCVVNPIICKIWADLTLNLLNRKTK